MFLIAGDFNIDSIENDKKLVPQVQRFTKKDIADISEYYISTGGLDNSCDIVNELLEQRTRYGLMMALLNSGTLRVIELHKHLKGEHLVTMGEPVLDEATGEYKGRDPQLHGETVGSSQQGLDYMMLALARGQSLQNDLFEIEDIRKEEFTVKKRPYDHLSDHSGVEIILRVNL